MKYIFILLAALFWASCSQSPQAVSVSKIKLNLADTPTVYLEDIADDISIVNLGPANDTTLSFPIKFVVTDSNIMIADRGRACAFKYDRKGNLINRIGHRGNGFGEYGDVCDAVFDSANNQWNFFDAGLQRIFVFATDGRFLKTLRITNGKHYGLKFAKNGNTYVAVTPAKPTNDDMYRLSFYEPTGDILGYHGGQLSRPHFINSQTIGYPGQFANYKDSLYFLPQFDDKIYKLGLDQSAPAYQFDLPADSRIPDELSKAGFAKDNIYYRKKMVESNSLFNLTSLFINDNWVSFAYDHKLVDVPRTAFYSKKTGKVLQLVEYRSRKDPDFKCRSKIVATNGNYFVIAAPIIEYLKKTNKEASDQPQKVIHISQQRLVFFKLKDA